MSKIISIGTAVPHFKHDQNAILQFMQRVYSFNETDRRKLKFLYHQSSISSRYSVIPDYSRSLPEWKFYPHSENLEPFPSLEHRMVYYQKFAAPLSVDAIRNCLEGKRKNEEITHLITVSCTGMSAPGLDLMVMDLMDLPHDIFRTSINFMGCYAAIHALKIAHDICTAHPNANVLIVCTELCTLHFQREATVDNITSSLLFGDGSAAMLVTGSAQKGKGIEIDGFYSEVITKGKKDMAWEISSSGFLMTLSSYIPELIQEDFEPFVQRALKHNDLTTPMIDKWCVHPGGKKILEAVQKSLHLPENSLSASFEVLKDYGNMSSPTILFVLKKIMQGVSGRKPIRIFSAAFGPGLTMETFLASV